MTGNKTTKEISKKPSSEPYQEILLFPETGKLSLFKSKNYRVLGLVGVHFILMHLALCVFDFGVGPDLV